MFEQIPERQFQRNCITTIVNGINSTTQKRTPGAHSGRTLIESMLAFIKSFNQDGATISEIKSFMLKKFGLKPEATLKYVKSCALVGFISEKRGTWRVTKLYVFRLLSYI